MSENQNYSELKWSFADFIKRLDSILVKDSSGVDFMLEFIDHCIKDGVDNPLRSKNRSNETRYLNDEKFSKKKAEFIKNNFNLKKLSDYLESIFDNNDNDDNVNDLCEEFFPNNQNVTYKNLAEELTKLFLEILRKRIEEIDPRPREKYEVFIPLGEEKVFENKIKETVKAIYAIASSDELKDHPISATYIKKRYLMIFYYKMMSSIKSQSSLIR